MWLKYELTKIKKIETKMKRTAKISDSVASIRPSRIANITLRESDRPQDPFRLQDIPRVLQDCELINNIHQTLCQVKLTQQRYGRVQQTSTLSVYTDTEEAQISYSLLNSILFEMTKGTKSCVAGSVKLVIQGTFGGQRQRVVSDASTFTIPRLAHCDLIYIPISVQWTQDEREIAKAIQAKSQGQNWTCNNCLPGHAMALFFDNVYRTIQVYDSNGNNSPYYVAIADWIERRIQRDRMFYGYTMLNQLEVPQFGIQAGTNIAMCGYFAALYAALRIQCPDISPLHLNNALLEIKPVGQIVLVLQQWHCYPIEYARQRGILQAAAKANRSLSDCFNIFINERIYFKNVSEKEQRAARQAFADAQLLANTDIVKAVSIFDFIVKRYKKL